ncbi:MAG TPA: hypothetical protein VEQ59_03530, partial [Polyangiaceae bacterium]|nr:hypothetical protein [Polyangiaceae bacterium]
MSRRASAWLVLGLLVGGCGRTPPAPVADLPRLPPRRVSVVSAAPAPAPPPSPEPAAVGALPEAALSPRRAFAGGGVSSVSGRHGIV